MDNNLSYRLTLKDYFRKTMLGAAEDTKKLDGNMNRLDKTISKVGTGIATYFTAGALKSFASSVIDSLKNYEYFSASLRTLMYGDKSAAKGLEGQLVKLAATTPFSLVDVQSGAKQLLAYGFSAGNLTKDMKTLGDISSGVGAPLNDIIYLYGTLKTQGRAYSKDIMQFTGRGIPIIAQLAKQFGVTEGKVKDLVEQGKVGFPEIEKAFNAMTSAGGQFFGMMDEQSKTVGGRLSNLADTWEQIKVNIGKSQTGIISGTVSWVSGILSSFNDVIAGLNRMDEAFKASGKNIQYTMMEKFNNTLFMGSTSAFANMFTGGKGKMDMLERSLQSMYVKPSQKDEVSALQSQSELLRLRAGFSRSFANKEIGKLEYERSTALITQALEQVSGNLRVLKDKRKPGTVDGESSPLSSSIGSPTEVTGPRPQNVTINVNKLGVVENMNIDSMKDGAKMVKEEWSKELLEILNDANLIARR